MVAAATGQGRRFFACGNQSAAKPVTCFQVVSLLLAGEGHREANGVE
jgi:hypothetical protein